MDVLSFKPSRRRAAFTPSTLNTGGFALISYINFESKSNCNQSLGTLEKGSIPGLITRHNVDAIEVCKTDQPKQPNNRFSFHKMKHFHLYV